MSVLHWAILSVAQCVLMYITSLTERGAAVSQFLDSPQIWYWERAQTAEAKAMCEDCFDCAERLR
jgi:hypothetical protein